MFLSTASKKGLYKVLLAACNNNAEKLLNKKLFFQSIVYSRVPSLKFIFFLIFFVLKGSIFSKKKCLNLKFQNISIGRFIVSEVSKNAKTFYKSHIFTFNFFINLIKAGKILRTCDIYLRKKVKVVYVDHCGYLNGIIFSYFGQRKKVVFTNNYPYSIFRIDFRKKKNFKFHKFENILKVKYFKSINTRQKKNAKKTINKMSKTPGKYLPWMKNTKFEKKNIDRIKKYDYLIYCHSFTDAQLWYGNDGFCNTFDWLKFTLNILEKENKKVLIKSHPNYFNKWMGERSYHDKVIFNLIKNKYKYNKNFYFINEPIYNYELMKKISKKCILITHHGTVINESVLFNFKSIASMATFWDQKYKISNTWMNENEYKKLLSKDWHQLKYTNENDLFTLFHNYYFHKYSYHGKNYWQKIISKTAKINFVKFTEKIEYNFDTMIPQKIHRKIIQKLDKAIMKI